MVVSSALNQVSPLQGRPTIFGNVSEKNVVFLIDTSGSMYHSLNVVKEHLLEILFARAVSGRDTMFNLISFSEEVDKWSDRLIQCTTRTVSIASEWINKMQCGTSTNTMEALVQAYEDDCADAVYMVTDGLPDQRPDVILENVRKIYKMRPVHSIYLTGTHTDPAAQEFLEDLSRLTQGSFHVISLTLYGGIQKVIPIFNHKTAYTRRFDGEMLSTNLTNAVGPTQPSNNYSNSSKRPGSAPPASGFVPRIYDPGTPVTVLRAPHGVIPIPYVSWGKYAQPRGSSKILDYADSVIKARGLADDAGVIKSDVPVAASVMNGMKVLARRDTDGLYYMAVVQEQAPDGTFMVEFDKCPALRKSYVQDVGLHDMVAYKDAIRHHVCLGDKVLAPWQPDGRYGPGTVLDGVDRRDTQPEGYEGSGKLMVTFYNGETINLEPGVALRIPLATFDRIVTELQLPESQRRKIKLASSTRAPPYDGRSPPTQSTWTRPFSPPTTAKHTANRRDKDELSAKIEEQLERNKHLLQRLELEENETKTAKGVSFVEPQANCECGEFQSEDSYIDDEEEEKLETFDIGTDTGDFERYVRLTPEGTVLNKSGGKPEPKKRWRWWSSGVPPRPPRFRETILAKPAEPRDKSPTRPPHSDYHTTAGVAFPRGTDKKHFQSGEWPGAHRQWKPVGSGTAALSQSAPNLKHHEYMSNKGVAFPQATDRKFATAPDQNWHPGQSAQAPSNYRSSNWEDGLGHGDIVKNKSMQGRLQRKRDASERYHTEVRNQAHAKEHQETARQDFHRRTVEGRNVQIKEQSASKAKQEANRMEYKKQASDGVCRKERGRQENAENWKHARVDAMKERRVKHEEMEQGYEKAAQEYKAQRVDGFREREQQRNSTHHERLTGERRMEENRGTHLRERENSRQTRLNTIKRDVDKQKEMRIHVKRQNEQRYRASILP